MEMYVLISTITIEPMAYMKKPGSKKKMYKSGSFLEPNKELSFGSVKKMATGGGGPNESPVDSAAAARRGAESAAKKKAEEQRLAREEARRQRTKNAEQSNARQRTARDGSTMDKIGVMGTGATKPKPQDVGAKRAGSFSAQLAQEQLDDAKKAAAAKAAAAAAGPEAGTYASAKKKNPNLDKLIKERKGLTKGTVEYNRVQNQINKAYDKGPMRTEVNKIAPKPATKNPERNPTIKSSTPAKPAAKKPVAKVSTKPTASRTGMSPQGDTRALQAELKSAAPAASAKKPIDRRNARSARKTDRLKKRVGKLQGRMQAGGKR